AQSLEASMSLAPERIDRGLYELEWQPMDRPEDESDPEARTIASDESWLIFTDQSGVGAALAEHLKEHGVCCVIVSHTDSPEMIQQGKRYAINPANPEHFQHLFTALSNTDRISFSRVIHLWS